MSNFIDNYMLYATGNEASPLFHRWAALSTLSAVVSRKCWVDQSYYLVYPNIYVVFVGEPGDKKTTAMTLSRAMAMVCQVPIAPPSITKEAITLAMNDKNKEGECKRQFTMGTVVKDVTHLSFFSSEIMTLLTAGGNPENMITFFTDIYDCDESFKVATKGKGTDTIVAPYVTMLACMTSEQVGSLLKQALITGGFSRRVIFVYGRARAQPIARPKLTPEQIAARKACIAHLQKVKQFYGEYIFDDDAEAFFETWYAETYKEQGMPHPAVFKNWLQSKNTMLLKVAMLLDMAGDMTKRITLENLHVGLGLLNGVEGNLGKIFAGSGRNPIADIVSKIQARLEESPKKCLTEKQLMAAMFSEARQEEINEALNFLLQQEIVAMEIIAPSSAKQYRLREQKA